MKTIILINGKNPLLKTGGYQTYTRNLGTLLSELGYSVKIVCLGKNNRIIKTTFGELHIIASPLLQLPIIRSYQLAGLILFAPQLARYIRNLIKKDTVLYGIGPWSIVAIFVNIFRQTKAVKILSYLPTTFQHETKAALTAVTIKDYGIVEKIKLILAYFTIVKIYSLLESIILKKSDYIITHYLSAEKILKEQFNTNDQKFIRLPYYIEFADDKPEPIQSKHPLILLVSRHDARKGINILLHAFAKMNTKKLKYSAVIIGDGPFLHKNRQLAKKLDITNVTITGFVKNPFSYLKHTDLFVFPSVEEGSSAISILEVMKEGLPIVSTDVDGIPEDLTDGKSALLVDPMNSNAIAQALEKLLQETQLAKKLGAQAKKEFLKKHDREETKKSLAIFLKKI